MNIHVPLAKPYAQSPELHSNLFLSSFQVLIWILFRPPAWRAFLAQIDPALPTNCALVDLQPVHFRNPLMRRVLRGYVIYTPLILGVSVLMLWLFDRSGTIALIGIVGPLLIELVLFVVGGFGFSLAVGLVLSVLGGLIVAAGYGAFGGLGYPSAFSPQMAMFYTMMLGMGGSIAGSVTSHTTNRREEFPLSRWEQRSRWITGVLSGIVIGGAAVAVAYSLLRASLELLDLPLMGVSPISMPVTLILLAMLVVLVVLTVDWWRARLRLEISLVSLGVTIAMFATLSNLQLIQIACLGFTVMLLGLITLPYIAIEQIVGPRVAAIAGTLGLGGGWTLWMMVATGMTSFQEVFLPALGCLVAGLMLSWWGPLFAHPLLEIWNVLLLRLDEHRPTSPARLRWHAALWNQTHRLRFYSLVQHLVLVAERDEEEGRLAIECLSLGRQRWAAQAAQIELIARRLERCATVEDIVQTHSILTASTLDGPVSPLMRAFARVVQTIAAAHNNTTVYHKRLAFGAVEEALDRLLREMTVSSDGYALRFHPVAMNWRTIVLDYVRTLNAAIEDSQEIDNPYIFSVPLVEHQNLFVGRADVAARIEQLLLDRRRPPLLLYGQRRMGKTSLLRNLGRLLPSNMVLLFIDGEGIAGAGDYPDLLYAIALAMGRSAEQHRNVLLPKLGRDALAVSPFVAFGEWLDDVERTLEGQGFPVALLALDEFEALDALGNRSGFDARDMLRMLRNLVQHRPHFKVLLAGSHTLDEFRTWASYLINMQVVKISYLSEAEAIRLIEHPVEDFLLRYDPAATQRIMELTRGHPHLVQLLCYEIVERKNRQSVERRRFVELDDVECSVAPALSTGDFFFSDIAQQAGDASLEVAQALAERGEGTVVDAATLAQHCSGDFDAALTLLLRRDVVEAVDGGYRFQVELIRRWFIHSAEPAFVAVGS